jgi:hypothetical protein
MNRKIVDLVSYRIEKGLRKNGFTVKKDNEKKIKIIIKIREEK